MELAIPLIALGGMYVISNQNQKNSDSNTNVKEPFVKKQKQNQNQNQNQTNNYNSDQKKTQYTKTINNSSIQKSKQTFEMKKSVENTILDSNSSSNSSLNSRQNFKPTQANSMDQNPNKYLSTNISNINSSVQSNDFDINSIIENYTKQKNNGISSGKNFDVSFNVPRR